MIIDKVIVIVIVSVILIITVVSIITVVLMIIVTIILMVIFTSMVNRQSYSLTLVTIICMIIDKVMGQVMVFVSIIVIYASFEQSLSHSL